MKKIISLVLLAFILTPYTVFSQWFEQNSGTTMPLRGVYFIDENIGTIVGDFGTIIKTTNGGITWISQSSGTTVSLKAVFLVNENIGTVVGSEGTILRTTNGGENWISQTSGSGYELTGVSFSDEENGIVVGGYFYNGLILKTTNGGNTWETSTIVSHYLKGVCLTDTLNGTVVGSNGTILRTTDGGVNWSYQSGGTTSHLNGVSFTDKNFGTVVGFNGTILRTTNGGTDWNTIQSGITSELTGVSFSDENHGTVVGYGQTILRTTDGCITWEQQGGFFYYILTNVQFINTNIGTAIGYSGHILHTLTGGPVELTTFEATISKGTIYISWTTASEINNSGFEVQRRTENTNWATIGFKRGKGTTTEPHSYSFTDENLQPGKYSYRLKQVDFDGMYQYSEIVEVEMTPSSFSLSQNYPNPFNPITNIEYRIPNKEFVELKVYDVLGKEVAALVNEEKPSGNYSVKFDGSRLPSGIYFYRIKTGNFSSVKKLILLK